MNQSKPSRWVIGSRPDCDIIVDQPTVSGRHCQIQFEDGQWQVKDLDSTNGTWVDGVRIEAVRDIDRGTPIRLGQTVYLDWQQVPSTEPEITIGRSKENDVTLEHASVSGRHARLRCTPDGLVLEDLGSTNGTYIDGVRMPPHEIRQLVPGQTIQMGANVQLIYNEIREDNHAIMSTWANPDLPADVNDIMQEVEDEENESASPSRKS